MSFKVVVISVMLASGALGGGLAYFSASGTVPSVKVVTSDASDMFRSTMRKFDGRVYVRGPDYGICLADYGRHALGKTNAEITLSCECFDKNLRLLSGTDREAAIAALNPSDVSSKSAPGAAGTQVADLHGTSVTATRVLRKCGIEPAPSGFLSMRGTM